MLSTATNRLIEVARDSSSSPSEFQNASAEFFSSVGSASAEETSRAILELAHNFNIEDPRRVAILGLICGALAEEGSNTKLFAGPLLERFALVLQQSARLVEEIEPKLPPVPDDEEDGDDDDYGAEDLDGDEYAEADDDDDAGIDGTESDDADEELDAREKCFQAERKALGSQWQAEKRAWDSLDQFWQPSVLVLSLDPSLRRQYAFLARDAHRIAEFHVAGYWIRTLLSVMDDEPIVVIEPSTKQGILARISGVVDNFQLHMILMDIFPHAGFMKRRRISKDIANLAKGNGPQSLDQTVTGAWNLYDYRAVQANLQLPDEGALNGMEYWIWNEGCPADIPELNGRRAILLGPPTYQRQWGAVRMFERLPAEIVIERALNRNEVKEWLEQMKSTDR